MFHKKIKISTNNKDIDAIKGIGVAYKQMLATIISKNIENFHIKRIKINFNTKKNMKKKYLIILSFLLLNCNEKNKIEKYFLSENGKTPVDSVTREKYIREAKSLFSKQAKMPIDSIYNEITYIDTIVKKDSLIFVYKETYYFGKPSKEKLENEKFWDNFTYSLLNKEFITKSFKTIKGNNFDKLSLKNNPSVINLWFTTCAPCIEEMPFLNQLKEKFGSKVNFVSLTFNNKEEVENFLKKRDFNYIHLIDEKSFLKEKNIIQYPINLFLDKNGVVKKVEGNIPMITKEDGSIIADIKYFEDIINKLL